MEDSVNYLGKLINISCYLGQDLDDRVQVLGQNYRNIQKYMYISVGNFNPAGSGDPPCPLVCPPLEDEDVESSTDLASQTKHWPQAMGHML